MNEFHPLKDMVYLRASSLPALVTLASILIYIAGLLICLTADGYSASQGSELWLRARYVHVGVAFAAFPLLVLTTMLLGKHYRPHISELDMLPDSEARKVDRLLVISLFVAFAADFYLLVLFIDNELINHLMLRGTLVILNIGVLLIVIFRSFLQILQCNGADGAGGALRGERGRGADVRMDGRRFAAIALTVVRVALLAVMAFLLAMLIVRLWTRLSELVAFRYAGLSAYLMISVLVAYIVYEALEQYKGDDPPHVLMAHYLASAISVGLLGYIAIVAFAHSVYRYIPSSRFGGDYTTMSVIQLCDENQRNIDGHLTSMAGQGAAGDEASHGSLGMKLLLLDATSDVFLVAPFGDPEELKVWRRGIDEDGKLARPKVVAIGRDRVAKYCLIEPPHNPEPQEPQRGDSSHDTGITTGG